MTAWGDDVSGAALVSIAIMALGLAVLMVGLALGGIAKKLTGSDNFVTRWAEHPFPQGRPGAGPPMPEITALDDLDRELDETPKDEGKRR